MTIVFFVTELGRGGAETQLKRIAEVLRSRGNRVTVISLMPPVGYVEELREAAIAVESLGLRRGRPTGRALLRARRLVRRIRPDIVCCFLYHATLLGVGASAGLGAPLIASIRDPSFGSAARLRLARALVRAGLVRAVVANNETVTATLRHLHGFPPGAVHFIPNGLKLPSDLLGDEERRAARAALGIGDHEFLWLHVGNFQAPKDHANLLRAFERVVSARSDARLRMVGLGEPPPTVAELMLRPTIASRVAHLGERPDVLRLMQASDALVLSSSSEGLPNVVMEALGVATPVVSTRVGGVGELIEDGVTGILVTPRDDEALAAGMLRLMSIPDEERRRMQVSGRHRILERYDLDRVVDEWERLFASIARSGLVAGRGRSSNSRSVT